jgi:hypothetical protein
MSLYQLLYCTRSTQASDGRDKIYALLGLSSSPEASEFQADYSLSTADVCKRTVVQLIRVEDNLSPLVQWSERNSSLPSRVPDYTASSFDSAREPLIKPGDVLTYSASGAFKTLRVRFSADLDRIYVKGRVFDLLESVEGRCWWDILEERLDTRIVTTGLQSHPYRFLDLHEPLWKTLTASRFEDSAAAPPANEHREWSRYLYYGKWLDPVQENMAQVCVQTMKARCIFTTRFGCVGIGPQCLRNALPGDMSYYCIVILYGSDVPFFLLRCEGWYQLVGECYVSGTMGGEFMDLCEKYEGQPAIPEEQEFEIR